MTITSPLTAFVVDDSAFFRKILTSILKQIEGVKVIGCADNGRDALRQIQELHPDLVTLDLSMPEMDGAQALKHFRQLRHPPATIIITGETSDLVEATIKALQADAYDFITKPTGSDFKGNASQLLSQLIPLIHSLLLRKNPHLRQKDPRRFVAAPVEGPSNPKVLGIGASTGGPAALTRLLPHLLPQFPVPILLVQHLPKGFTQSLAKSLNDGCALNVVEAEDGMFPEPGWVYIAPGSLHMKIDNGQIRLTNDPPEQYCKPSVDYLFRSLAYQYGSGTLGLLLTGMGEDGVLGLGLIKTKGGRTLAQDQSSCAVFGMPGAAIAAGVVDHVAPLSGLSQLLNQLVVRPQPQPLEK